jgi:hypothetical protein
MSAPQTKRANRLARSFDIQVFLIYLSLKRHQRRPGAGAVIKIVAKIKAISLIHIGRYSITT